MHDGGYASRFIGPLNDRGDPIGGRSVLEAGIELRTRIGENFGLVPFLEAGTVLVKDIFPGEAFPGIPNSGSPAQLTDVNGTLLFTANGGPGATGEAGAERHDRGAQQSFLE